MAKIVLHLKPGDVSPELNGWHLRLYKIIRNMCQSEGISFIIKARDSDIKVNTRNIRDQRFQDGNLHIIDDRSVHSENVLNAGVAYFWEHWHLDPVGTKAFSSIGDATYDPQTVSPERALGFSRNLKKRYLQKRLSKYSQPDDTQSFQPGSISVFFQGQYPINAGATQFSDIDMLRAVQNGTEDRRIVVKPHPLVSDKLDIQMALDLASQDDRIQVTDANVHDILSASAATVSINSTVALEGFMHGVPALLFGKSDFHHIAGTVSNPALFSQSLDNELRRDADYDRYLTWYFVKHCIQINNTKVQDKIWDCFERLGFPKHSFH